MSLYCVLCLQPLPQLPNHAAQLQSTDCASLLGLPCFFWFFFNVFLLYFSPCSLIRAACGPWPVSLRVCVCVCVSAGVVACIFVVFLWHLSVATLRLFNSPEVSLICIFSRISLHPFNSSRSFLHRSRSPRIFNSLAPSSFLLNTTLRPTAPVLPLHQPHLLYYPSLFPCFVSSFLFLLLPILSLSLFSLFLHSFLSIHSSIYFVFSFCSRSFLPTLLSAACMPLFLPTAQYQYQSTAILSGWVHCPLTTHACQLTSQLTPARSPSIGLCRFPPDFSHFSSDYCTYSCI